MVVCQNCFTLNFDISKFKGKVCGHPVRSKDFKYCVDCAVAFLKCQKCGAPMSERDLVLVLEFSKPKIGGIILTDDSITIPFENGLTFVAAACSGPGNRDWHNWTQVTINGKDIINK